MAAIQKTWRESLVEKLLSGRFLLTVMVGLTFSYLACVKVLDKNDVKEVTLIVITFYFTMKRSDGANANGNGDGNGNGTDPAKKP